MVGTFKVGDRVRMIQPYDGFYDENNNIATVVDDERYAFADEVGCVFDHRDGLYLYNLNGLCEDGFGYLVGIDCLEHYKDIVPISLEEMV